MDLTAPESLIFWTTIIFLLFLSLLRKYAWKPILEAVKNRENTINEALLTAEEAKKEMQSLKADNKKLLQQARTERDAMLREARQIKDKMISDATKEAQTQGAKIIEQAKATIESEKNNALAILKNQVSSISIEIAEKLLKTELSDRENQTKLVEKMLEDVELN